MYKLMYKLMYELVYELTQQDSRFKVEVAAEVRAPELPSVDVYLIEM